ncbi:hypothetical protein, partial [Bacteroides muris (ex Fokt et al. 2023)]
MPIEKNKYSIGKFPQKVTASYSIFSKRSSKASMFFSKRLHVGIFRKCSPFLLNQEKSFTLRELFS